MVGLAFSIAASCNFPIILLSMYWSKLTTRGAMIGGWLGLLTAVILMILGRPSGCRSSVTKALSSRTSTRRCSPLPWRLSVSGSSRLPTTRRRVTWSVRNSAPSLSAHKPASALSRAARTKPFSPVALAGELKTSPTPPAAQSAPSLRPRASSPGLQRPLPAAPAHTNAPCLPHEMPRQTLLLSPSLHG